MQQFMGGSVQYCTLRRTVTVLQKFKFVLV